MKYDCTSFYQNNKNLKPFFEFVLSCQDFRNNGQNLYLSTFFFRPIPEDDDFIWGAIEADFDTGKLQYKVRDDSPNDKLFPLRVRLQEDRIMGIEKIFFCDRTTEKTVHLEVSDLHWIILQSC